MLKYTYEIGTWQTTVICLDKLQPLLLQIMGVYLQQPGFTS